MNIPAPSAKSRRQGMAVIVVMGLLALVLMFMAGNARTLHYLSRDLKLIETKQKQRLAGARVVIAVETKTAPGDTNANTNLNAHPTR